MKNNSIFALILSMGYSPRNKQMASVLYKQNTLVKVEVDKPKFYVLDMFPYPSGEGLHVGTPLVILPRIFLQG